MIASLFLVPVLASGFLLFSIASPALAYGERGEHEGTNHGHDHGRGHDRDREKARDWDRDEDRERGWGRNRDRDRGWGRDRDFHDRDRGKGSGRGHGRDRGYGKDRDREHDKGRGHGHGKGRGHGHGKDRGHGHGKDRGHGHDHDHDDDHDEDGDWGDSGDDDGDDGYDGDEGDGGDDGDDGSDDNGSDNSDDNGSNGNDGGNGDDGANGGSSGSDEDDSGVNGETGSGSSDGSGSSGSGGSGSGGDDGSGSDGNGGSGSGDNSGSGSDGNGGSGSGGNDGSGSDGNDSSGSGGNGGSGSGSNDGAGSGDNDGSGSDGGNGSGSSGSDGSGSNGNNGSGTGSNGGSGSNGSGGSGSGNNNGSGTGGNANAGSDGFREVLSDTAEGGHGAPQSNFGGTAAKIAKGVVTIPGSGNPQLVVAGPSRQSEAAIAAMAEIGAQLVRQRDLASLNLRILVFDYPTGLSSAAAQRALSTVAPQMTADFQTIYRFAQFNPRTYASEAVSASDPGGCVLPRRVRIGMIDGPVDTRHPALANASVQAVSLLERSERSVGPRHGTAIAAQIVGQDSKGALSGFAQGAHLVSVAIFTTRFGAERTNVERIAEALDYLLSQSVRLINMSFTGPDNLVLRIVLDSAAARGAVMVAAVGTDGEPGGSLPAASENVIGITAVDSRLRRLQAADTGPYVEFAAPGVDLFVAGARYGKYVTGTSFAAPIATSVIAGMIARGTKSLPAIRKRLRATAADLGAPGKDDQFGWGLVQANGC